MTKPKSVSGSIFRKNVRKNFEQVQQKQKIVTLFQAAMNFTQLFKEQQQVNEAFEDADIKKQFFENRLKLSFAQMREEDVKDLRAWVEKVAHLDTGEKTAYSAKGILPMRDRLGGYFYELKLCSQSEQDVIPPPNVQDAFHRLGVSWTRTTHFENGHSD
jgi:hypothetical protein